MLQSILSFYLPHQEKEVEGKHSEYQYWLVKYFSYDDLPPCLPPADNCIEDRQSFSILLYFKWGEIPFCFLARGKSNSLNLIFLKVIPTEQWMGARFWITRTAFRLPTWTPAALHSLIHCFPCFVRLCWWRISVLDESCGHGLLLVRTGEQMGFFLWASLASSLTKLSLTFTLSPSYILVCALCSSAEMSWNQSDRTGVSAQAHGTGLACAPQAVEVAQLCITVQTWAISVPEKKKNFFEMLFLCLPLARSCDLGRFCDSCVFVTEQQQEREKLSLLACSFSLCLVVRAAICCQIACPHLKFYLGGV